jgi:hypothetical protein
VLLPVPIAIVPIRRRAKGRTARNEVVSGLLLGCVWLPTKHPRRVAIAGGVAFVFAKAGTAQLITGMSALMGKTSPAALRTMARWMSEIGEFYTSENVVPARREVCARHAVMRSACGFSRQFWRKPLPQSEKSGGEAALPAQLAAEPSPGAAARRLHSSAPCRGACA